MIEYDNVLQSAATLRGYRWYTHMHFPVPAYMFLVTRLRWRTVGPMVERAWVAVEENYGFRGGTNNLHGPMHATVGGLLVKAWDARAAGLREEGRGASEPGCLAGLRTSVGRRKGNGESSANGKETERGTGWERSRRWEVRAQIEVDGWMKEIVWIWTGVTSHWGTARENPCLGSLA